LRQLAVQAQAGQRSRRRRADGCRYLRSGNCPGLIMSDSLLSAPLARLEQRDAFIARHLGPNAEEIACIYAAIGVPNLDTLIAQTVSADIRLASPLPLANPMPEHEALARLKAIAGRNVVKKSLIGQGYYGTHVPAVVLRNVLENPGWYTAYTP